MVCTISFVSIHINQFASSAIRLRGNTRPPLRLRVVYTGFGTGREAFNAAILSADGAFVRALIGQVSCFLCCE
jgi:hypothetical protein